MNDHSIILPPTPENSGRDAQYHLTVTVPKRRYLSYLRERWWVVLTCLALSVSGVVTYETTRLETYTSHAQLYLTLGPQMGGGIFAEPKDDLATQIELLKGPHLFSKAMERLGPKAFRLDQAVDVDVVRPMGTTILQLRVTAPDPSVAQEFLQALIDEYLAFKKSTRLSTAEDLVASLTDQLKQREDDLKAEQEKWLDFQKTNNLPVLEEESKSAGMYLAELNLELAKLKLDKELLVRGLDPRTSNALSASSLASPLATTNLGLSSLAKLASATSTNLAPASSAPDTSIAIADSATNSFVRSSDTTLKAARLELALVQAQKEKLLQRLPEMHPSVRRITDDVDRLKKTVAILEDQNTEQKRLDLDQTLKRIAAIEEAIPEWGKKVLDSNVHLTESQRLRSSLQRQQGRYDLIVSMLQTVDLNKNVQQERITVTDPPSPGAPAQRNLFIRITLAVLAGIAVSLGIVFAWYMLDDRFVSERDVKDQFGEMVMGLVPQIKVSRWKPEEALIDAKDSRQAYVESYRHLRSALLLSKMDGKRIQALLLTGARAHEGKTTIAINLARMLALGGLRVALVDGDARGAGVRHLLGHEEKLGVLDFLRGDAEAAAVRHPTELPLLTLVPIGSNTEHFDGLFVGDRIGTLLQGLREDHDFVVVDGGPILSADDSAMLVPHVDSVVLVVRPFYTASWLIRASLDMLYQRRAKNVSIVLNRARKDDVSEYAYYPVSGDRKRRRKSKAYAS